MRKACERCVNACLSSLQVTNPSKMKLPLKSVGNSEINENVQIDQQKICMTKWGQNQILLKNISLHETGRSSTVSNGIGRRNFRPLDHALDIAVWLPMTFQSDNGKASLGELTKELIKRSQISQALVNMLRVYCLRYMTDWDKYLPQQHAALNHGNQSFHDANGQGEINASNVLLPIIRRTEDITSSIRERGGQETTGIEKNKMNSCSWTRQHTIGCYSRDGSRNQVSRLKITQKYHQGSRKQQF